MQVLSSVLSLGPVHVLVLMLVLMLVSILGSVSDVVGSQMLRPAMAIVMSDVLSVSLRVGVVEVVGAAGAMGVLRLVRVVEVVEVHVIGGTGSLEVASSSGKLRREEIGESGKETQEPGMMVTWRMGRG